MILKNQTGPTAKIRVLPSIFGKGQKGSLSCSKAIMAPLLSVLLQPPFSALTALMSPLHWRKIVSGKNHTANEVICVIIVSARKAAQKGLWGHRCQQEPKQRLKYSRADISLEFQDLIHTVLWVSMKTTPHCSETSPWYLLTSKENKQFVLISNHLHRHSCHVSKT